jgi:branched-chain amino acid transport system ATP-binding protein
VSVNTGSDDRSVLDIANLSVSFGSVQALQNVSLQIRQNQIVGLIGPNGAGKTTLVDALTGFVSASGSLRLNGSAIEHLPAHRRARAGLARTWQAADLFEDLTVRENLTVGQTRSRASGSAGRRGHEQRSRTADHILDGLGLSGLAQAQPSSLSEGHRKLVGVGRALMSEPAVLMLDEPAAGLNSSESALLGAQIKAMANEQTSVLLIDHDMNLVLSICDYIIVLDFGQVISAGKPDEVRRDDAVIAAYLGTQPGVSADASAGSGDRDA